PRPALQLSGRQRRGPASIAFLAAELAPPPDPGPTRAQGLRPGEPRIPRLPQSSRGGLYPAPPGRYRADRQQPVAVPPGHRARSWHLFWDDADRDGREGALPRDHGPTIPAHARALRLLLAPPRKAPGMTWPKL